MTDEGCLLMREKNKTKQNGSYFHNKKVFVGIISIITEDIYIYIKKTTD